MTQDIDLEGNEENQWTPIGIYSANEKPFCGIFDGKNKVISGLYIKEDTNDEEIEYSFGLFGNISYNAKVKNLTIKGEIEASGIIGGICGYAYLGCQIENCCSEVGIKGIGLKTPNFVESEVGTPPVEGFNSPMLSIGGICGSISNANVNERIGESFFKKCQNKGNISVDFSNVAEYEYEEAEEDATFLYNMAYIGGIVGTSSTLVDILDSYNEGDITVKGDKNVVAYAIGGVCGFNVSSSIENCYNIGDISTADLSISNADGDDILVSVGIEYSYIALGGVVGQQSSGAYLSDASNNYIYNSGAISSSSITESNYVGSICGKNSWLKGGGMEEGSIQNAYYLEVDGLKAVGAEEGSNVSTTAKDNSAFESGEVAWLLHKAGGNFGQGLDADGDYTNGESSPVLLAFDENNGKEVYKLDLSIGDEEIPTPIYRNAIESNLLPEDTYHEIMNDAAEGQDLVWENEAGDVFSGNSYKVNKDETLTGELKGVYNITTMVTPEGAGEISNIKATAANDEEVSFSLGITDGYKLLSVTMNEETLVDDNADGIYTFTMPAKDVTITATFEKTETGDDDDDKGEGEGEGGITTKRYQLFLADQDFYMNDEYDAEGLVLFSRHDKRYAEVGGSFTIYYEKDGEMNAGDYRIFWSKSANGEYKEVKLDEVSGYFQIRNVQSDVYVKIYGMDGFPVANESIEAQDAHAYAQANKIVVITPEPTEVQIISMAGAVVASAQVAGQQEFVNLTEGVYIVRMGESVVKLQVRN